MAQQSLYQGLVKGMDIRFNFIGFPWCVGGTPMISAESDYAGKELLSGV